MKKVSTYDLPITIESSNTAGQHVFRPFSTTSRTGPVAIRIVNPQRDFDVRVDGTLEVNAVLIDKEP